MHLEARCRQSSNQRFMPVAGGFKMTEKSDPRQQHRFRFRLWMLLTMPIGFAAIFVVLAGINPLHSRLYWVAFKQEMLWHKSDEDYFLYPQRHKTNCILKISHLCESHADPTILCFEERWSISPARNLKQAWAQGGGEFSEAQLNPAGVPLSDMQKVIATLPPSERSIPLGRVLMISFREKGIWVTRVYDWWKLPPQATKLCDLAGITGP
jgi:hypothetical protein